MFKQSKFKQMSLKIKDVYSPLMEGIAIPLINFGFAFDRKKKYFIRDKAGFEQILDLIFDKDEEGHVLVEPFLRIKSKLLEDIYHKIAIKDKQYFASTRTLGNSLGRIIEHIESGTQIDTGTRMRYLIENMDDVSTLIQVIPNRFSEYALPYFEKYSSLKAVDQLLNVNTSEISIHQPLYPMRACIGIIAAKLNNNPKYNELVVVYENELEEAKSTYKEEFRKLKEILKSY